MLLLELKASPPQPAGLRNWFAFQLTKPKNIIMDLQFQQQIPANFHSGSRVWAYQANRAFNEAEATAINSAVQKFAAGWLSHGDAVKAFGHLFFNQFIVLMADESSTQVSGCSTDGSVRLIKEIEQQFNVEMFNRQQLAFAKDEAITILPLAQLNTAVQNGVVNGDTLYFNNTILTKAQLLTEWIIPARESWLAKRVNFAVMA